MNDFWNTLKKTYAAWNEHEVPRLGAALAFYTILSLAPLVILVIAVVALALGHSTAQEEIIAEVQGLVGSSGAEAVRGMIEHAQQPASGFLASAIGLLTLLFGASGVFGELRMALNKIWDVKPKEGAGIMAIIQERFFSFGMVLAIGFLLLVSLVMSAALASVGKFFSSLLPVPEVVLTAANFAFSFFAIAVLFALIFKYVPETRVAWSEVWGGALATAFLFGLGKLLIGLYLGKAAVGSAYGAAGSLIVVLVWVYYSSQIFFFGAEFTRVRALEKRSAALGKVAGKAAGK